MVHHCIEMKALIVTGKYVDLIICFTVFLYIFSIEYVTIMEYKLYSTSLCSIVYAVHVTVNLVCEIYCYCIC